MRENDVAVVRDGGNVFRDLDADSEQLRSLLAARIIGVLDTRKLTVRAAYEVSLGRPFKMTKHQRREAIKRRAAGELLTDIARNYNVSPATISRLAA